MRIQVLQDMIDVLRGKKKKLTETEKILKKFKSSVPEPIDGNKARMYYVEIFSDCDLKCPICAFGSRELFERKHGKMSLEKFNKILDKIKLESPDATVSPYHYCEPSLHPQLPEMIKAIKDRSLRCAVSFNFNRISRLEDILSAGVDSIEVSVSGFYQATYEKSHVGGNIENVKTNLRFLREKMDELNVHPTVYLIYHMYKDNLGEDYDKTRELADSLGFHFQPCWSRSINLEMSLKYIRENKFDRYKGETEKWFDEIPPLKDNYKDTMARMIHMPQDYLVGKWEKIKTNTCPCDKSIINIRWTGEFNLCGWAFDDRNVAGDFLTTPIEDLYKVKKDSFICKECLANNYAFYTNYIDMEGVDKIAYSRLDCSIPADRKFGG